MGLEPTYDSLKGCCSTSKPHAPIKKGLVALIRFYTEIYKGLVFGFASNSSSSRHCDCLGCACYSSSHNYIISNRGYGCLYFSIIKYKQLDFDVVLAYNGSIE